MRVVLTQSEGRLEALERELAARGFEVLRCPLIGITPLDTPEVRAQAAALLELPWLLFASRSAVEAWQRLELPLGGPRLGAVGHRTARALDRAGGYVYLTGQPATAAGLAQAFLRHPQACGPVGLPRGERGLSTLQDTLERHGFAARPLVLYRTALRPWTLAGEVDAVVLASPSAVEALPEEVGWRATLVALGPTTGAAIAGRGWTYRQAARPDAGALVAALTRWADEARENEGVEPTSRPSSHSGNR